MPSPPAPRQRPKLRLDARKAEGLVYFFAFIACIPLANWMIGHWGTVCVPQGPCLVPVFPWGPGGKPLMAPSGVLMIGIALVLRDLVQRRLGVGGQLGRLDVRRPALLFDEMARERHDVFAVQ